MIYLSLQLQKELLDFFFLLEYFWFKLLQNNSIVSLTVVNLIIVMIILDYFRFNKK